MGKAQWRKQYYPRTTQNISEYWDTRGMPRRDLSRSFDQGGTSVDTMNLLTHLASLYEL
jgi:hypothetical protein